MLLDSLQVALTQATEQVRVDDVELTAQRGKMLQWHATRTQTGCVKHAAFEVQGFALYDLEGGALVRDATQPGAALAGEAVDLELCKEQRAQARITRQNTVGVDDGIPPPITHPAGAGHVAHLESEAAALDRKGCENELACGKARKGRSISRPALHEATEIMPAMVGKLQLCSHSHG